MGARSGRRNRGTGAGFTLVELLLTVALLVLLFGAVVFNFSSLQQGARLDEGASQLETLFRFARAQAAGSGRQVRVVFGDPAGGVGDAGGSRDSAAGAEPAAANGAGVGAGARGGAPEGAVAEGGHPGVSVSWEPDPLGAPGKFEPLREALPYVAPLAEMVKVLAANYPGARRTADPAADFANGYSAVAQGGDGVAGGEGGGTNAPSASDGGAVAGTFAVTFYPDGSSDSAEVVLGSQDDEDRRQLLVSLSGITGAVRRRLLELVDGQRPPEPAEAVEKADPGTGSGDAGGAVAAPADAAAAEREAGGRSSGAESTNGPGRVRSK